MSFAKSRSTPFRQSRSGLCVRANRISSGCRRGQESERQREARSPMSSCGETGRHAADGHARNSSKKESRVSHPCPESASPSLLTLSSPHLLLVGKAHMHIFPKPVCENFYGGGQYPPSVKWT